MFLCFVYILCNLIQYLNSDYLHHLQTYKLQKIYETKSRELELSIFNQCFNNDDTNAIVILGNWSYYVHHFVLQMFPKSLILLSKDKTDRLKRYETWERRYLIDLIEFPINKFIIHQFDVSSIQLALYKLKYSKWWNIDAFFLINNGLTFDSCKSVYLILSTVWKFNILNTIYLCHSPKDGIGLYTFNPYSLNAPKFWTQFQSHLNGDKYQLTFFVRHYKLTDDVLPLDCKALIFDKAKNLSNYSIIIATSSLKIPIPFFHGVLMERDIFYATTELAKAIWKEMGCNLNVVYYNIENHGGIEDNGNATDKVRDVLHGKYDTNSIEDYQLGLWKNEIIYFRHSKVCFLIKKDKISMYEQLSAIFSVEGFIVFLLFFGILSALFKFILKIRYLEAMIDVLRTAAGLPMIHFPTTILKRSMYICLIFAIIVVNTCRQCQWSAALTTRAYRAKNVKNAYDLIKYQFKVYAAKYYKHYCKHTSLKIREISTFNNCINLVNDNTNVACMKDCIWFRYLIRGEFPELQVVEDEYFDRYSVFLTRDDFPLRNKAEIISLRYHEHGLQHYIEDIGRSFLNKAQINRYEPISINKLKYSFYNIIIVHILSIFIFLCEIIKKTIVYYIMRKQ